MNTHPDEDLPYRSPVTDMLVGAKPPTTKDEVDYDTLKAVQDILTQALAAQFKDFNAFKLLEGATTAQKKEDVLLQIAIKQGIYEILVPVVESVVSAVQVVNDKYKEK